MYNERVLETGLELLCWLILLLLLVGVVGIGYDIIHDLVPVCFHPVGATLTLTLFHFTLPRGSSSSRTVLTSSPQKLKLI